MKTWYQNVVDLPPLEHFCKVSPHRKLSKWVSCDTPPSTPCSCLLLLIKWHEVRSLDKTLLNPGVTAVILKVHRGAVHERISSPAVYPPFSLLIFHTGVKNQFVDQISRPSKLPTFLYMQQNNLKTSSCSGASRLPCMLLPNMKTLMTSCLSHIMRR